MDFALACADDIGERHLGGNHIGLADDWFEDGKECEFGRGHESVVAAHHGDGATADGRDGRKRI